jgi:hypothetical protein
MRALELGTPQFRGAVRREVEGGRWNPGATDSWDSDGGSPGLRGEGTTCSVYGETGIPAR